MSDTRFPKSLPAKRRTLIISAVVGVATVGAIGTGAVAVASGSPFSADAAAGDPAAIALDQCSVELQQSLGVDRLTEDVQIELELLTKDGQQSTLLASGESSIWCQGEPKNLNSILINSSWFSFPEPAKDTILVGPRTQDVSEGGQTFVLGRAGTDVRSIVIIVSGTETPVTLNGSWWTATWPTGTESELNDAVIVYTLTDGTQQKSLLNDLVVPDES